MYSVFLSSYTNTRESLGELEKAVETLACGSCSHNISRSPKLPLVFVYLNRNTIHVFYFLNVTVRLKFPKFVTNLAISLRIVVSQIVNFEKKL